MLYEDSMVICGELKEIMVTGHFANGCKRKIQEVTGNKCNVMRLGEEEEKLVYEVSVNGRHLENVSKFE